MTFKSSNRLGEKRVQFLNSGQNSSIVEALWLLIWILLFTKIKKIMSWAEKCFHLLLELPNKPFKWSTMPIPWLEINCWKSENAKMTQNGLSSPKCIFWLQPYRSFKKSTRNLRGINYQMEYMWWAPHKLKNSLRLQWGSQLHCTLYRSFIATLYV